MKYLLTFLSCIVLNASTQAQAKWTLKECIQYALQHNISIQKATLDVEDANLNKQGVIGSFLPSINGSASHSWNNGLTTDVLSGILENQTTQNTSLSITAGVDIFSGLKNMETIRRAKLNQLSNLYQLDDMKDNISLNVANAFLQILFNKESHNAIKIQHEATLHETEVTKRLIQSGLAPKKDLLEIEAILANEEQQIVNAENAVRISLISLAQLLTITQYETFDITSKGGNPPQEFIMNLLPNDIYEKSVTRCSEIKISETSILLAEKDMKIARGSYFPTLSGFYYFNTRASNQVVDVSTRSQFDINKGHSFGFSLSVPVFNGFSTRLNLQRNQLNLERAKLNFQQAKIDLESSVYQAYNDAKGAFKAFNAAEKTLLARQEAYNHMEEMNKVGAINGFEFRQCKQSLSDATSELIKAKYDYIFKLKVLEFYFGVSIAGE